MYLIFISAATSTATATSTQETDVVDLTQTPPANGGKPFQSSCHLLTLCVNIFCPMYITVFEFHACVIFRKSTCRRNCHFTETQWHETFVNKVIQGELSWFRRPTYVGSIWKCKFPFSVKQIIYCITELKSLNKITFKVIRALQITLLLLFILFLSCYMPAIDSHGKEGRCSLWGW